MKPAQLDLKKLEKALEIELIANGRGTQALHDVVVAYRANRRAGTRSTKTKATVKATGSKPWRQKGTGRARAGYSASPIWRGGGVVFGPQPRDYSKKISKKTKKTALKKALSELAKNGDIYSTNALKLEAPKTKELAKWIKENELPQSLLIVTEKVEPSLVLASRNLPKVEVIQAGEVNAEHLITYKKVLVAENALPVLAGRIK